MKTLLLLLALLLCQTPQNERLEAEKGLGPYKLNMGFNPKSGLKLAERTGNTTEYKGTIKLYPDGVSINTQVSASFYKEKLMAFAFDVSDPRKTQVLLHYLETRYGKGVKNKDESRGASSEIIIWSSPTVRLQVIIDKKTGAGWFDFISNPLQQLWEQDSISKLSDI